jgi:hypothetical protein
VARRGVLASSETVTRKRPLFAPACVGRKERAERGDDFGRPGGVGEIT